MGPKIWGSHVVCGLQNSVFARTVADVKGIQERTIGLMDAQQFESNG